MFARNVATAERQELLLSARAALRLHNDDHGIWSNWDLVVCLRLRYRFLDVLTSC